MGARVAKKNRIGLWNALTKDPANNTDGEFKRMKSLNELHLIAREAGDTVGSKSPPCEWFLGPEGMFVFARDKTCKRSNCLDIVCEPRGVGSGMAPHYIKHITTFDPKTVLKLIERLRKAEAENQRWITWGREQLTPMVDEG